MFTKSHIFLCMLCFICKINKLGWTSWLYARSEEKACKGNCTWVSDWKSSTSTTTVLAGSWQTVYLGRSSFHAPQAGIAWYRHNSNSLQPQGSKHEPLIVAKLATEYHVTLLLSYPLWFDWVLVVLLQVRVEIYIFIKRYLDKYNYNQ